MQINRMGIYFPHDLLQSRSLFLYVQSNQNPFFKVFKVPETKAISLNDFDEIVGSFQFGVGIRQFHGVYNLVLILQKCLQYRLENRINSGYLLFDEVKEMV